MRMRALQVPAGGGRGGHVYLGTHRLDPPYMEGLDACEPVNRLWDWYMQRTGEAGFLSEDDLENALELIREYNPIGVCLQLVELAATAEALGRGRLLGFDLSASGFGISLLEGGLSMHLPGETGAREDPFAPLYRLVECHFQPKLNESGLLPGQQDAEFLRDVLIALDSVDPGGIESDLGGFQVVAIGLVYP